MHIFGPVNEKVINALIFLAEKPFQRNHFLMLTEIRYQITNKSTTVQYNKKINIKYFVLP